MSAKIRLATVWLDGCSGCHMSLLDMDERLLDIADRIELVSSPLMDVNLNHLGVRVLRRPFAFSDLLRTVSEVLPAQA